MNRPEHRAWIAEAAYPGKKAFWFGTVFLRPDAPLHEVEAEVRRVGGEHLPDGFRIANLKPGMIIFADQPSEPPHD